jgi:hypothetical protein
VKQIFNRWIFAIRPLKQMMRAWEKFSRFRSWPMTMDLELACWVTKNRIRFSNTWTIPTQKANEISRHFPTQKATTFGAMIKNLIKTTMMIHQVVRPFAKRVTIGEPSRMTKVNFHFQSATTMATRNLDLATGYSMNPTKRHPPKMMHAGPFRRMPKAMKVVIKPSTTWTKVMMTEAMIGRVGGGVAEEAEGDEAEMTGHPRL